LHIGCPTDGCLTAQAHALCEAFDGQLRVMATDLTEKDVALATVLSELRAEDLRRPPPTSQSRCTEQGGAARNDPAPAVQAKAAPAGVFTFDASGRPQRLSNLPSGIPHPHRSTPQRHQRTKVHSRDTATRMPTHDASSDDEHASLAAANGSSNTTNLKTPHARESSSMVHGASAEVEAAWEVPRLQHELQAALSACEAAQRSAVIAEEMAGQQQASFALSLRRERERLRAEHQEEISRVWKQIADLQSAAATIRSPSSDKNASISQSHA
jgi:hypothetical protein